MITLTPNYKSLSFKENIQKNESNNSPAFEKLNKKDCPYNDPLMKWPIRGLAFTNDIGAAVMDIAPKLGTLLWYPAMMYFGADIYDKYRNNKESYDPNTRRGLSQAIFQAFASVIFPIVAVHAGQKTASVLARKSSTKLSLQSQEEASKFLQDFMTRRKLYKYKQRKDDFKSEFATSLDNFIDNKTREHENKNVFKKFFDLIFSGRHPEEMGKEGLDRRKIIHEYMDKKIDDIFEIRESLDYKENVRPQKISEKLYKEFKALKEKYSKDPDFKYYAKDYAIKDVINNYGNSQIFKVKMKKTLGGFITLGLLIKPIDMFVEKIIMHKIVEPQLGINHQEVKQVAEFKNKNM